VVKVKPERITNIRKRITVGKKVKSKKKILNKKREIDFPQFFFRQYLKQRLLRNETKDYGIMED